MMASSGLFLFIALSVSLSWATFINVRHSIHLSVNEPDDPRFKLDNMEMIANEMLAARRIGRQSRLAGSNPYLTPPQCDYNAEFRTIDGTCNNRQQPWMGAAKTPLIRMSPQKYQDDMSIPRQTYHYSESVLPTPRRVSLSVHMTTSNTTTAHTHLLMNFGQFIDHDITLSPESGGEGGEEANKTQCCEASPDSFKDNLRECFPISTANDPIYRRTCIPFLRSAPIPGLPNQPVRRYQMNDLTSFLDASMIYGSTQLRAKALRSYNGGKLKSARGRNGEERLPDEENNPRDCFRGEQECRYASGDVRNSEQAALTSVHTLMLRHHNKMAEKFGQLNPHWDDERIYQNTRKIMAAIMQKITYNEFLPVVLGPKYMRKYDLTLLNSGRYMGYSSSVDSSVMAEFSTAAFRFGHSLIRQTFTHSGHSLDLKDIFDSYKTTTRYGTDGMLKGILEDKIEACDKFITSGVRDNLFGEEMDLISFNIQRGRDHGLGSYHDVKKALGLHTERDWNPMAGSSHSLTTVNDMKKVYPHPDDIELFCGGMSEIPAEDAVVGDTFAHIIGMQFRKLRRGDRFWHETPDTRIGFTDDQLAQIRKITFATLFCENVPGVAVRRWLLRVESQDNPRIDCSAIPSLNWDVWRDGYVSQPAHSPSVRHHIPSESRPPVNRPPVNRPPVNRPPVNRPPVNRPPVNRPPVNRPTVHQTYSRPNNEPRRYPTHRPQPAPSRRPTYTPSRLQYSPPQQRYPSPQPYSPRQHHQQPAQPYRHYQPSPPPARTRSYQPSSYNPFNNGNGNAGPYIPQVEFPEDFYYGQY